VLLVSLDIDGTVEGGDPSGPVPLEFARRARALGAVIGSSSDRTISDQRDFWEAGGVQVDFLVLKHQLPDLPGRYPCNRYLHIGDSMMDEYYATVAGFEFWSVPRLVRQLATAFVGTAALTEHLLHRLGAVRHHEVSPLTDQRVAPIDRRRGESQ